MKNRTALTIITTFILTVIAINGLMFLIATPIDINLFGRKATIDDDDLEIFDDELDDL